MCMACDGQPTLCLTGKNDNSDSPSLICKVYEVITAGGVIYTTHKAYAWGGLGKRQFYMLVSSLALTAVSS